MKRFPFCTLLIGAVALLIHLVPGLAAMVEFNRDALVAGEVWRLFTGHLAHFSSDHLRWDLVVFLALGTLVELRSRAHFIACCVLGTGFVSGLVWWLQPWFVSYRGLSGLDSALFVYVTLDVLILARKERHWLALAAALIALLLFCAKVVFEYVTGSTVFVSEDVGFSPVPLAHVGGAVVGAAVLAITVGVNCRKSAGGPSQTARASSLPTAVGLSSRARGATIEM